jgi:hypothetical protein
LNGRETTHEQAARGGVVTPASGTVVLEGGGEVLVTPPDLGELHKDELVGAFRGTKGLKAGKEDHWVRMAL